VVEEWGPEQTRHQEELRIHDASNVVIMHWIEKAFRAGYESPCETIEEAWFEFGQENGTIE